MELGQRIKMYRNEKNLSQELLADRVYVSRQTISNWENEKSYPDINSLILLSEVFETTIDNLVKGNVEKMKQEINKDNRFICLDSILRIMDVWNDFCDKG